MALTGNGASISISGFTGTVQTISGIEHTREALDVTPLDAADFEEVDPAPLRSPGSVDVVYFYDSSNEAPLSGDAGTVTLTFPLKSGQTTAATLSGTGFLTRAAVTELNNTAKTMGEITVQWDGKTGPTYTAGS